MTEALNYLHLLYENLIFVEQKIS